MGVAKIMPGQQGLRYSRKQVMGLIEQRGGGHRSLGREHKRILFKSMSRLPKDIVDWAVEKLVFVSSLEVYRAYTLNLDELVEKGKAGLVVLCDNLKDAPEEEQTLDIAHEIAHCWLKHATTSTDIKTMKEVAGREEKEADDLAIKWLSR
jgi:hypothetical protein